MLQWPLDFVKASIDKKGAALLTDECIFKFTNLNKGLRNVTATNNISDQSSAFIRFLLLYLYIFIYSAEYLTV